MTRRHLWTAAKRVYNKRRFLENVAKTLHQVVTIWQIYCGRGRVDRPRALAAATLFLSVLPNTKKGSKREETKEGEVHTGITVLHTVSLPMYIRNMCIVGKSKLKVTPQYYRPRLVGSAPRVGVRNKVMHWIQKWHDMAVIWSMVMQLLLDRNSTFKFFTMAKICHFCNTSNYCIQRAQIF